MKATKKSNSLIALLLLAVTFNNYSMEKPKQSSWKQIVGGVLLGTIAIKKLWQVQQSNKRFAFTTLPQDMQNQIIYLLSLNTTATSLKEAAFTINSLAQVNHELNELINGPQFCLQIIKHLAQKFNCYDATVCEALQTKEAKHRLELQRQLCLLCNAPLEKNNPNKNLFVLESLYQQGVDLEFTYDFNYYSYIVMATPLMIAVSYNIEMAKKLCSIGNKPLNIDQSNLSGITALKLSISNQKIPAIEFLLGVGADPEIADNDGVTPLQTAQETGIQEIVDLIQDAIDKKHGNK